MTPPPPPTHLGYAYINLITFLPTHGEIEVNISEIHRKIQKLD